MTSIILNKNKVYERFEKFNETYIFMAEFVGKGKKKYKNNYILKLEYHHCYAFYNYNEAKEDDIAPVMGTERSKLIKYIMTPITEECNIDKIINNFTKRNFSWNKYSIDVFTDYVKEIYSNLDQ